MVKITTKQQFEELIHQMELYPSIARGVRKSGENKADIEKNWRAIANRLNFYGPPMRSIKDWQRVWIHFKAKLKKKMVQNKKNLTTGGGPSQEIRLSQLEQAAADLLLVNIQGATLDAMEKRQQKEQIEEQMQTPNKKTKEDEKRIDLLEEQTETQTQILITLNKIEQHMRKSNEILNDLRSLKKRKYETEKEEKKMDIQIKQKKLELLERQVKDLDEKKQ